MEDANALGTVSVQQAAILPPPHRRARLRVREVSSRFMSPLVASNAITTPTPGTPATVESSQRSKSVQRRRQLELDENLPEEAAARCSENNTSSTPLALSHHLSSSTKAVSTCSRRKQQQQQRVKPFKENDAGSGALVNKTEPQQPKSGRPSSSSRSDTPTVGAGADRDRIIPSRYRLLASQNPSLHRPPTATSCCTNGGGASVGIGIGISISNTAAAKLLQEATSTDPLLSSSCITSAASDLRSSMPAAVSSTTRSFNHFPVGEFNNDILQSSSKFTTSPCSRSLNLPQSDTENPSSSSWLCLLRAGGGDTTVASKISLKNQFGSLCLPPHPSSLKLLGATADAKKGRKLFNHQEDVHSLKLLYNHHLQWRFANAKSEVSMLTQKMETERQLYSLGSKMSDLRDVVKRSRIELELLQRIKTLSTIVEYQMPCLDEWSVMAEDYSHSLSGVTDALLNLSIRLPISGGVKVDVKELSETLYSAVKVIEMITVRIQSYMVKAEEMEMLISELARVMGGERTHIQECGDFLLKAYASQVEEFSLRGHLIQLRSINGCKKNISTAPLNADV
ncbi:hypothetical protein ACH5RR_014618 [Cinchona calisaya]|uniref:Protein ENDOSPERM DEFECTIVE 1 n=1 Tax=Cinchona calisaya TaxID=153742 RepID=A0ABD2ZQU6_9GENT